MTIQLKPEQKKFLKAQVASGKYNSPQEVVDKMFLVFERIQGDYEQWLEETQIKIDEGKLVCIQVYWLRQGKGKREEGRVKGFNHF